VSADVTHVVCDPADKSRHAQIRQVNADRTHTGGSMVHVVSYEWIQHCIDVANVQFSAKHDLTSTEGLSDLIDLKRAETLAAQRAVDDAIQAREMDTGASEESKLARLHEAHELAKLEMSAAQRLLQADLLDVAVVPQFRITFD
jgi:hypothetical protein